MHFTNRELLSYSLLRDLNFKISIPTWKSSYSLFKLQTFRSPTVWGIERDFQLEIDIRILFVPTGKRNSTWCFWILYITPFQTRQNAFHMVFLFLFLLYFLSSFIPSFFSSFLLSLSVSAYIPFSFFFSPTPFLSRILCNFYESWVLDSIIQSQDINLLFLSMASLVALLSLSLSTYIMHLLYIHIYDAFTIYTYIYTWCIYYIQIYIMHLLYTHVWIYIYIYIYIYMTT